MDSKSQKNREIIYGIHPVTEALKSERRIFYEIYVVDDIVSKRHEKIKKLAFLKNIPLKRISIKALNSITETTMHQMVGARVSPYPLSSLSDIIRNTKNTKKNSTLLLLDNIVDPHNFGALVRTAVCAGVGGIIIPKDRSVKPLPTVSKVSAGAMEHILIARVINIVNAIKLLKKEGFWVVGMDRQGDGSIYDCDLSCPVVIVIGGEEKGIRLLVKKNCDFLTYIPQIGQIDSLNASVAGGIVLYEAFRQKSCACCF